MPPECIHGVWISEALFPHVFLRRAPLSSPVRAVINGKCKQKSRKHLKNFVLFVHCMRVQQEIQEKVNLRLFPKSKAKMQLQLRSWASVAKMVLSQYKAPGFSYRKTRSRSAVQSVIIFLLCEVILFPLASSRATKVAAPATSADVTGSTSNGAAPNLLNCSGPPCRCVYARRYFLQTACYRPHSS